MYLLLSKIQYTLTSYYINQIDKFKTTVVFLPNFNNVYFPFERCVELTISARTAKHLSTTSSELSDKILSSIGNKLFSCDVILKRRIKKQESTSYMELN